MSTTSVSLVLSDSVREIEDTLSRIHDPIERIQEADRVRADLSVVLTHAIRRSAYQVYREGRLVEAGTQSWRKSRYLYRLAKQYSVDSGAPMEKVKDVMSATLLDLNDLVRLRGGDL